jgi:hypothetical protein
MKAFPAYEWNENHKQMMAVGGMDLRDYFAAKAMQGLIGINLTMLQEKYDLKKSEMIAVLAYSYADAMILAREAKNDS